MIAVVGADDDEGAVELSCLGQGRHDGVVRIGHGLCGLHALAPPLVQRGQPPWPKCAEAAAPGRLVQARGVEPLRAGNGRVLVALQMPDSDRRGSVRVREAELEVERLASRADVLGRLSDEDIAEEVLGLLPVGLERSVDVQGVAVPAVHLRLGDRNDPAVPARGNVGRVLRAIGVGIEVLAHERGLDALGREPGGQAVLLLAESVERRPAAAGRRFVRDDLMVVDVLAAQDRHARGAAQRVGDRGVREGGALRLQGIEPGHLAERGPVEIIGEDEHDVVDLGLELLVCDDSLLRDGPEVDVERAHGCAASSDVAMG